MTKYLICLLLLINFFFPGKVLAVTETSGEIQVTHDNPLFPASISWYPGLSITKSFAVKNLSSLRQTVYLEAFNTFQTGEVDKIFLVNFGAGEKTLRDFWNNGMVNLSGLSAGATGVYNMTIQMATSSGNIYQKQQAKFGLIIGFMGINNQVTITAVGGGGNPSTELTTTPGGGFIAGPAAGFIPGVLGTQENLGSGSATVSPELINVLGTQAAPWWDSYWWMILIAVLGLGGALTFLILRTKFKS